MDSRWIAYATLGTLAACAVDTTELDAVERKKPKPGHSLVDAATTGDFSSGGIVSCYSQAAPSATCTLPARCCFSQATYHDGSCSTTACSWGSIACDGPEDCAAGQNCCATYTSAGVQLACQSGACAAPPAGDELCHEPSICPDGRWCITAFGTQPALPQTLAICR